jgi:hypothetical protein
MSQSRTLTRVLGATGAALLAVLLVASVAQAREPAPGYSQFAGCPSPEENSITLICLRSEVTGGHFQMGSKDVQIENPIVISGGVDEIFGNFTPNSKGGMSKAKQKVPGGLVGLTGLTWLAEFLGSEALTVYAVTELAGQPDLNVFEEPLTLPIKAHLVNPVLGKNCYVGSTANPIVLNLITGTTNPPPPNKPITGVSPKIVFDEETSITHLNNSTYVDNSFSAPGASGCVLTLFGFIPISLDTLVNAQSGLPAAAGTNETRQVTSSEATDQEIVYP